MQGVTSDLVTGALTEIRVARAGDVVGPDDMDLGLRLLNEMLDGYNADKRAIYARQFLGVAPGTPFTLTPNHNPHTIGLAASAPDFVVTVGPPSEIIRASLVLQTNIRHPLNVRNEFFWSRISAPAITSSVPSDLYYSLKSWPVGSINLYPIPLTAYQIELMASVLFAQVALTTPYDFPFGYQAALRLSLAEKCSNAFGQPVPPTLKTEAAKARAIAWGNNNPIPELNTIDGGMPGSPTSGGYWDYRTGFNEQR